MSMDMDKERPVDVELRESASIPGSYEGNATLKYTGMWKVTATVSRVSGTDSAAFDLSVTAGGPNWTVIIVFGAAMATVIVAAAILRSRRAGAEPAVGAKA
jgi:anti-sigma-K factor RskA